MAVAMAAQAGMTADDVLVVTGSRAPEAAATAPIAITAIDAEAAARLVPIHPAEILNRAPGAMAQAGSGQEHLTAIRSPVLTGGAGAGSFLYLQDGVPLRSAGFANVNGLFDAAFPFASQIEVVRGPGDVAYGSNAVHGAINVLSVDPLGDPRGQLEVFGGDFDRYGATATLIGERGDQGFLLGLHGYSDGGYRADSGVDQYKAQIGHGIESGRFTVRTRLQGHVLRQETAGFVQGPDAYAVDDLRRSNPNPNAYRDSDHMLLSSTIDWQGDAWAVSVTPYGLYADMQFRQHFLPSQAIEDNGHAAIGVLSSARRSFGEQTEILFGLDGEFARGFLRENQENPTIFSFTQGVHFDYDVDAISAAPFARIRHRLSDRLTVQAGVRATYTQYEYDNKLTDGQEGRFIRPADRTDDFLAVTGRLGATYEIQPWMRTFASVSRGARPPQTTDLYRLQINQEVGAGDVETLDMAELGLRIDRNALRFELVGFVGRKENFLFRDADGFTVDDGVTTHKGIEFDLRYALLDTLQLFAAGTVARHEYDFERIVGNASEIVLPGNEVDTAPTTIGQFGAVWTPVPALIGQATVSHVGNYFTDAANENRYPGHNVLDLSLSYDVSDAVRLTLVGKNVTDTRYATRADFAFGNERYFPGEEAHMAGRVTFSW